MAPTKNPMGRFEAKERAMAAQTVARARPTDKPIAFRGLGVKERAAAGGPMRRLKMRREPTTGTAIVVARAITIRKVRSILGPLIPRASAASGMTDESKRGRYRT